MKTILLCMCILFVAIGTLSLNSVAVSRSGLPTTAPAEETIISLDELYATQAAYPTSTPHPTQNYAYPPPIDPYPAPVNQEDAMNEFAQLIISIFGINHNGKNVQHK